METVDISFKAPKELADVRAALMGVIKGIQDKKNILVVAAENLVALQQALTGLEKVGGDFQADLKASAELAGFMGGELIGVLFSKPAVVHA